MRYRVHMEATAPRDNLRERVPKFFGPLQFNFAGHTITATWQDAYKLRLFAESEHPDDRPGAEPPLGLAPQALRALFLLALETEVEVKYRNHEVNGQFKLIAGSASFTRFGNPQSTLDLSGNMEDFDVAWRGIISDRHLRAAFDFYRLGIQMEKLGREPLTTRPALVQFGLALEAIGYRLGGHDGLKESLEDIATAFPALPTITEPELTEIRNARHHGAHYRLTRATVPPNLNEVFKKARRLTRDALLLAGRSAAAGTLPAAPPP